MTSSILLSTGRFNINFAPLNKHCLEVFTDVLPGDPNLRILSSVLSRESESRAETRVLESHTSPSSDTPNALKMKAFSNKIHLFQLRMSHRTVSEN